MEKGQGIQTETTHAYVTATDMHANQPGVVVNVQQPSGKTYAEPIRDRKKSVMALGILQVILGLLLIAFGIAAILKRSYFSLVAAPIWTGGALCIPAGFFGIMSAKSKPCRKCWASVSIVMSIFASLGSCAVLGLSATSIASGRYYTPILAIESCNIGVAFVEFIVSIVAASFACCCVIPDKPVPQQTIVVPQNAYVNPTMQAKY